MSNIEWFFTEDPLLKILYWRSLHRISLHWRSSTEDSLQSASALHCVGWTVPSSRRPLMGRCSHGILFQDWPTTVRATIIRRYHTLSALQSLFIASSWSAMPLSHPGHLPACRVPSTRFLDPSVLFGIFVELSWQNFSCRTARGM